MLHNSRGTNPNFETLGGKINITPNFKGVNCNVVFFFVSLVSKSWIESSLSCFKLWYESELWSIYHSLTPTVKKTPLVTTIILANSGLHPQTPQFIPTYPNPTTHGGYSSPPSCDDTLATKESLTTQNHHNQTKPPHDCSLTDQFSFISGANMDLTTQSAIQNNPKLPTSLRENRSPSSH